jgi:hypothetical protein
VRLPLLLLCLECGCAGPDEVSTAVSYGETTYGQAADFWDSNSWGLEGRLAWDVGTRAEANRALIDLHQEIARRSNLRGEAVVLDENPPPMQTESNQAEIITAISILISAIVGYWQRSRISGGVRSIAKRVTRKKEPTP